MTTTMAGWWLGAGGIPLTTPTDTGAGAMGALALGLLLVTAGVVLLSALRMRRQRAPKGAARFLPVRARRREAPIRNETGDHRRRMRPRPGRDTRPAGCAS